MTDIPPDVVEPGTVTPGGGFNPLAAARSIGLSLLINGICPYILYRTLEPHYPAGSTVPLLYASLFPVFGLVFNFVRTRTVDFIAAIALFEITFNVSATLLASSVRGALLARALQGLLTASVFMGSVAIGRPLVFYIARQFVVGAAPERAEGFAYVNEADKGRTFRIITLAWGCVIAATSLVHVLLVLTLKPADYLLVAQFLSMGMNIVMIVWTIRFSQSRLAPHVAAAIAARTAPSQPQFS